MAGVDVNRTSTNVLLPPEVSREIWKNTQYASVIQSLVPRIELPAGGLNIPIITGDPEADWVAETDEKPVSRPTFGTKNLKAYTLAVIVPFSNQFKRDLNTLYNALVERLPLVLAKKFDRTCLGFESSPGSGFDTLAGAPTSSLASDVYDGFVAALGKVAEVEGSDVERWVLTAQAEIAALQARDLNDRPLFIDSVTAQGHVERQVLARPVTKHPHAYKAGVEDTTASTIGFGGEWSSAMWGYVEGLRIDVSDQATLNDGEDVLNLWQRNMFAVRVEFEIGFAVRDVNRFVRLTGAVPNDET
jgi:HK97 family phage major capsid protein